MIHMAKGGARNRSGPSKDPNSGRSDRLGFTLTALPSEGYDGEPPEFPLPKLRIYYEYFVDGEKTREFDEGATEARWDREVELWEWAWSTPQACAWSMASWRWQAVAMWVRTSALCESTDATAADKNSLHRFADQIGLTPAGLKENGWAIAADELAERREEREAEESSASEPTSSRGRMKVVAGGKR